MTWLELFNKIGKQPLYKARSKDVYVVIDNVKYRCKLVYENSGDDFYLTIDV